MMIPYGKQDIEETDISAVIKILKSDFLTQGPAVGHFEESVTSWTNSLGSVASNSATSALHLACASLGVGPGDRVWTSPITFVASANCALYLGAMVDFVDVDPITANMCADALEEKLKIANSTNKLPKVIIPVHFAGNPCEMDKIYNLAQRYSIKIIEDASHAIGATYLGQPVGNCKYSDITIFSFHPVKIITCGEGGIATTNDPRLVENMARLRSHGVTRDTSNFVDEPDGPWYYEQNALGWNYRMTDIQAALGSSQLNRLANYINKRQLIARNYDECFERNGVEFLKPSNPLNSAYHLYVIKVEKNIRKDIFIKLRDAGIGVNVHYKPVHTQPFYQNMGFKVGDFVNSENFYSKAISIPMFPTLTHSNQRKVIDNVVNLMN